VARTGGSTSQKTQGRICPCVFSEQIKNGVLSGRAAEPEEIAAGTAYLASQSAKMVTGHNLMIDGGWTAQ